MRAIKKIFILLAVLLGAANACAENDNAAGLPLPAIQNSPNHAASHIDYLSNSFLTAAGNSETRELASLNATKTGIGKSIAPNDDSRIGLHWMTESQHPTLELPLSDQSTMRFHPRRHGGSIALGWKF